MDHQESFGHQYRRANTVFRDCCAELSYVSVPLDYPSNNFCGKDVHSTTATISDDLRKQHNHCFEVIVGNNDGSDAFVQRRVNVTVWEEKSTECEKYYCDNDNGFTMEDACQGLSENERVVQIEIELDDRGIFDFNATDFNGIISSVTNDEGTIIKYGTKGNGNIYWIHVKVNDEETARDRKSVV